MPADFAGQVVWITGASSGIGEALARGFAQAGARLVLSSRREIELERVRRTCARPDEHLVLPLDLACTDAFAAATATVLARCGAIDVLVNNAGVAQRALAGEATLAVERALMDVNYFGPVALTKAVLPAMRARRRGHVVVVGSVLGHFGFPGNSTYSAAKHALRGYFDSLRAEVWRDGIKVTLISPGYVRTSVSANAVGSTGEKSARPPPPRGISPERCAAAIIRGVACGREHLYPGGPEVAAVYLARFAPWLFSQLARRMKPRLAER